MNSDADTPKGGFPHSEICGSKVARTSPQLIAACYVLHRLLVPRHSPNALLILEISSYAGINPNNENGNKLHSFSFYLILTQTLTQLNKKIELNLRLIRCNIN